MHLLCRILVVTAGIDTEDTANVIAIARYAELAECITPLIQELTDSLADLVFAVLRMVAGTADGVDRFARRAVVEQARC